MLCFWILICRQSMDLIYPRRSMRKTIAFPLCISPAEMTWLYIAFRYKPLGFVRKQFIASELPYALTTILKEINRKSPSITITETRFAGGRTYCIQIEKITFLESEKHNVKIQLLTGESYTVREALSYYLNLPEFKDFVLINSGTMVNLAHIKLVSETISLKMVPFCMLAEENCNLF